MFTVVAVHQAGFICLHVEHAASGIEDPPACVDCQAVLSILCKHQRELCQGHPSVDVDNCRCDEHGRFLSQTPSTWPWTWPKAASENEENILDLDDNVSASVVLLSLSVRQDCLVAEKSTAEEIDIWLLPLRRTVLTAFDLTD